MGTGFSVISVPQVALFAEVVGLPNMFLQAYISFILCILIVNIIMVRIPPISRKADSYLFTGEARQELYWSEPKQSHFKLAFDLAVTKANTVSETLPFVSGMKTVGEIWFTLIPQVLVLGTGAMLLVDYTPVTQWLSYPFAYLLNVLQIPAAAEAAPAMIIGFFDSFLPVIVGGGIEAASTRLVILLVSMVQVVFMTTLGPVLLKSKIPINFLELLIIFLLRTIIVLPLAAGLAHILW